MRSFVGKVVSNKMQKSVVVVVDRYVQHPKYPKLVHKIKKFMAHDEENSCNIGDEVRIEGCRPLSKRKSWMVSDILREARVYVVPPKPSPAAAPASATGGSTKKTST